MSFPFITVRPLSDRPAPFYCHEEPFVPSTTRFGRHVEWLHTQLHSPSPYKRALVTACTCALVAVAILSIVGIYGVVKLYAQYRRVEGVRVFAEMSRGVLKPTTPYIMVKSATQTMNHVNEYVIENGLLWTKPIGAGADAWKPMYFDGIESNTKPISLSADGGRLFVLDDKHQIHTKLALKESWIGEQYYYTDLSFDPSSWSDSWCTMPVLGPIIGLLFGKRLSIPEGTMWATFDRGVFNQYFEDAANRKIPDPSGSAGLFETKEKAPAAGLYDVWVPATLGVPFSMPGSSREPFKLVAFSVSASTMMALGYSETQAEGTIIRHLRLYTQLNDIDTMGDNPLTTYTYSEGTVSPDGQVLPLPSWREHGLPDATTDLVSVTKQITILQTGQGNNARELRIMGRDPRGFPGMYVKRITDMNWGFVPLPASEVSEALPFTEVVEGSIQFDVFDWGSGDEQATITNFGPSTVDATLFLKLDGQKTPFQLHRRDNLILASVRWPWATHYDILKPKESTAEIDRIFQGREAIDVYLFISPDGTSLAMRPRCRMDTTLRYDLQRVPTKV